MPTIEHLPDAEHGSRAHTPARRVLDDFEEEIDLTRYIRPLARRWPLLVAVTLLGGIVGLFVSGRRPILYEASTTVLVHQAASAAALSTARALLRNYTLASETLKDLGLDGEPHLLTPHGFVDGALAVEELGGTHLLSVKVRLSDAELAARASHLLAAKAVELNRQVAAEGNTAVRDQLRVLLDEAALGLRAAEQQLLEERRQAQVEILRKDTEVLLDNRGAYQQLRIDIEEEKSRLAAAEQEISAHEPLLAFGRLPRAEDALRRASRPPPAAAPPAAAPPATAPPATAPPATAPPATAPPAASPSAAPPSAAPTRGGAVDPDWLDLSGPHVNPVYQTLAFQIATSRMVLAGMERRRREIGALHGSGANPLKPFSDLYRTEIEIARLENNYDLAKRVYTDLAVRYEQSRTDSIGNMTQLQVVDPATPPERPVSRRRVESLLAGLVGGFLLAALLALATSRERGVAAVTPGPDGVASQRA